MQQNMEKTYLEVEKACLSIKAKEGNLKKKKIQN